MIGAEEAIRQAISIKPDFAYAHLNLGRVLIETDRSQDAIAAFQEALRLDPRSIEARDALSVLLKKSEGAESRQSS
jgi:tetratricopeptide (TPR) repeat protein